MSRLRSTYGEQVDFINIQWDDSDSAELIRYFGILRRSTYMVISPDGEVLFQVVGPLNFDLMAAEIDRALSNSN